MKDIDFDELDKAVNSLMATTPAGQLAPTAATPVAPAPAVTPEPVVAPASVPTQATQPTPVAVRSVPPAIRRSGRFMDMVPANADKKPRDMVAPQPSNSREGLAISPRGETAGSPATETVQIQPETAVASPVAMPDPIDLVQDMPLEPELQSSAPTGQTTDVSTEPAMSVPNESPFLTDAKVEKRPLNAGMNDASEPAFDMQGMLDSSEDEPATAYQGSRADEPPLTPQIPELSSDLVAIESSEEANVIQATETSDAASQVETPSAPLGAASIAQQYQTQASTGDQSHAAIYDASQYPEPVSHPAKHKSGWLWVLWIVLLLGIGAGSAFLLYNFGIIP